jgi:hypothetical protein
MESNYTANIFNGNSTMVPELWSLMQNGMMLALPEDITSQSQTMVSQIETIMWSQMIPIAWGLAPGTLGVFILYVMPRSSLCSMDLQAKGNINLGLLATRAPRLYQVISLLI